MNSTAANQLEHQLAQLRDIRLPEEIAWWVFAPGWWIVAAVVCVGIISFWLVGNTRKNSIKNQALLELARISNNKQNTSICALAAEISVLLHRTVISLNTDLQYTTVFGSKWQDFLTSKSKKMPENVAHILTIAPYATTEHIEAIAKSENLNTTDLVQNSRKWIRSYA